jgi:Flp pilus assembly pilin Flp
MANFLGGRRAEMTRYVVRLLKDERAATAFKFSIIAAGMAVAFAVIFLGLDKTQP